MTSRPKVNSSRSAPKDEVEHPNHVSHVNQVIPVIEEVLEVTRKVVDTDSPLRIRKLVDEEMVDVNVPLEFKQAEIRRVPIGRVVTGPINARYEADVLIVPVLEERLVMRTELVLVEELHITQKRDVKHHREQVALRRERVVLERFDPLSQQWRPTAENPSGERVPGPDPPVVDANS